MKPKHLYTAKDVAGAREEMYKLQGGIDPILKEHIPIKGACLDHDHETQNCRAVLHRQTNAFEGKVYNAYIRCLKWMTSKSLAEILRNLADYYEEDFSAGDFHPGFVKKLQTMFNSLNEAGKRGVLAQLGQPLGINATERKALFKKVVMQKKFSFEEIKTIIEESKE